MVMTMIMVMTTALLLPPLLMNQAIVNADDADG